jgi:Ca2+-binding RTX toxin-like protein
VYARAGDGDIILISGQVAPEDVYVYRDRAGSDLFLLNGLNGSRVIVAGMYAAPNSLPMIAEVRFESAPGVVWSADMLMQMAMTGDVASNRIWGRVSAVNSLTGAAGDDELYGGSMSDTLDGGAQNDYLEGRLGADTYVFGPNSGNDRIIDMAGEGNIVQLQPGVTSQNLSLYRHGLTSGGTIAANDSLILVIESTGARLHVDQFFQNDGTGVINQIRFADGLDTVWSYADIVAHAALIPLGSHNVFTGTSADNVYSVDNPMDSIVEVNAGGIDTVSSSVSYTLPAQVENLELIGAFAFNGTGNADDNTIRGNAIDNVLNGGGGNDSLYGGLGNDTYIHRIRETIDIYYLYTAVTPSIFENTNEGYDSIVTNALSLVLPDNIERLWINQVYIPNSLYLSTANVFQGANYYGNASDNLIDASSGYFYGNFAPRLVTIDGGAGKDVMIGGNTATTYVVDNVGDVIIDNNLRNAQVESSITYTLGPNFSNLYLTGTYAINGFGNQFDNLLDGSRNSAANHLVGFAGNDTYRMGGGDTVTEGVSGGSDTIVLTAPLAGC